MHALRPAGCQSTQYAPACCLHALTTADHLRSTFWHNCIYLQELDPVLTTHCNEGNFSCIQKISGQHQLSAVAEHEISAVPGIVGWSTNAHAPLLFCAVLPGMPMGKCTPCCTKLHPCCWHEAFFPQCQCCHTHEREPFASKRRCQRAERVLPRRNALGHTASGASADYRAPLD